MRRLDPNNRRDALTLYKRLGIEPLELDGELYGFGCELNSSVKAACYGFWDYVVVKGDQVVAELGIDAFRWQPSDQVATHYVRNFRVANEYRHRGVATALFEWATKSLFSRPGTHLDHNGQSPAGRGWWENYVRTHDVDLSRHSGTGLNTNPWANSPHADDEEHAYVNDLVGTVDAREYFSDWDAACRGPLARHAPDRGSLETAGADFAPF